MNRPHAMNLGQTALVAALRGYRGIVSPVLHFVGGPGCGCRFTPTCSHYAIESVQRHGVVRGSALAARRVLRCAPWHPGGADPVPASPGGLRRAGPLSLG